jgi:octaprenyl-diphosphate synthase
MDILGVFSYLKKDMERIEKALFSNLSSDVDMIPLVGKHITASGGKRIRPAILALCSRSLGYRGKRMVDFACVVEYMHTASLLHDDVVDGANTRRGKQSSNSLFGNKISILVGDFLFSRASQIMVSDGDLDVLEIFSRTLVQLSEGEVYQLSRSTSPDISEKEYIHIVRKKTASLISAGSETAAIIGGGDKGLRKSFFDYGTYAGIAFQFMDDILDYTGYEEETGKRRGQDLLEGKITLPLIYTLRESSSGERESLVDMINESAKGRVRDRIIKEVIRSGGIEYTVERAKSFIDRSLACLEVLPPSRSKKALTSLTRFILERSN